MSYRIRLLLKGVKQMKTKMFMATVSIVLSIVFFSVPCFSQVINGCYHNKNGKLRIVSDHSLCKKTELPITWNVSSGPSPGWDLNGNAGTNPSVNFLGTLDNTELRFRVNDTVGFRIVPTSGPPNIIGGSSNNTIMDGVIGGVIGGGGNSTEPNTVNDCYSTIGGGAGNSAGQVADSCELWAYNTVGGGHGNSANNFYSTIGGGYGNTATEAGTIGGGYNNTASETATVGGGSNNSANGNSTVAGGDSNVAGFWAAVGGGTYNVAEGSYSTIAGGEENTASGRNTMIPGGWQNVATGDFSFAAGFGARANNQGCFVWNDNSNLPSYLDCNNDYRWIARTSGGVYFYTNSGLTSGVYVPAGGNAWSTVSDRAVKHNFKEIDGKDVLARLAAIPLQSWSYKSEDPSIRHMGPVAQDFHAAFGLGESERHISTIDADGVALAAIQGAYALLQEKEERMQRLEHENGALREEIKEINRRLATLLVVGGKEIP
jgi:hypothetical protein